MKVFIPARVNLTEGMNSPDSSRLIERCIEGDEQAIEMFVRQHETDVFRLTLSILQDPGEAHEATQDTFIAALKVLSKYQARHGFTRSLSMQAEAGCASEMYWKNCGTR